MPYTSIATVVTGTPITSAWGNSIDTALDFLANPPACSVYHATTQSIPNNTLTDVLWNTDIYDTASMHSTASLTNRITVPAAGLYRCEASYQLQTANDYTEILIVLVKNGTIMRTARDRDPGTANDVREIEIVRTLKLAASDWVGVQIRQINGAAAARTIGGAETLGQFTVTWNGLG